MKRDYIVRHVSSFHGNVLFSAQTKLIYQLVNILNNFWLISIKGLMFMEKSNIQKYHNS